MKNQNAPIRKLELPLHEISRKAVTPLMISLKKYLDQSRSDSASQPRFSADGLLPVAVDAYRSALREMGSCSLDACPGLGGDLKQSLGIVEDSLSRPVSSELLEATQRTVQHQLQDWGRRAAQHSQQRTEEVKEILIVMARTAESVGDRDQRCARQITDVTARLKKIANLEDLTEIRASIEQSAADLKTSIDRMADEGIAAIALLRSEVSTYQIRLEAAERVASRDSLTELRSRLWVENHIARRIAEDQPFCATIIDLNGFKQVNDDHGHMVGDEVLQQFSAELTSASRATDIVGRWGGDEFIILMDCTLAGAKTQAARLKEWVCGSYTIQGRSGPEKIKIDASIGLAERAPGESIKELLARADADMYADKASSRQGDALAAR
jgi:diguanylate cyclase (GGDEF)-like protein